MYKYLLFDLDGTISDSGPGITRCLQLALKELGIDATINELKRFVGPPLKQSFREFYGFNDEQIENAVSLYRATYSTEGIFENEIYPGMADLLKDLHSDGRILLVASSKPLVFVEKVLKHFGVYECFDIVMGSELDGSNDDKLEIIKSALSRYFGTVPNDLSECVMIGDRKFDIDAANAINMPNIGVSYGYGSYEELKEHKACTICNSVEELRKTLYQ